MGLAVKRHLAFRCVELGALPRRWGRRRAVRHSAFRLLRAHHGVLGNRGLCSPVTTSCISASRLTRDSAWLAMHVRIRRWASVGARRRHRRDLCRLHDVRGTRGGSTGGKEGRIRRPNPFRSYSTGPYPFAFGLLGHSRKELTAARPWRMVEPRALQRYRIIDQLRLPRARQDDDRHYEQDRADNRTRGRDEMARAIACGPIARYIAAASVYTASGEQASGGHRRGSAANRAGEVRQRDDQGDRQSRASPGRRRASTRG